GQKEESPVEAGRDVEVAKHVEASQTENSLVDWKKGRTFCLGDEEFYREMLRTFLNAHSDMELRGYYEESDFEKYRIKVHAVKTNLANIGAMQVSEMAKQLELALKIDNNVTYVQEHHEEFMAIYESVVSEVETYLENATT
ncbi:MAG: Hpt domain-containing protein, partial [Lachnospiraceae bacterium]